MIGRECSAESNAGPPQAATDARESMTPPRPLGTRPTAFKSPLGSRRESAAAGLAGTEPADRSMLVAEIAGFLTKLRSLLKELCFPGHLVGERMCR